MLRRIAVFAADRAASPPVLSRSPAPARRRPSWRLPARPDRGRVDGLGDALVHRNAGRPNRPITICAGLRAASHRCRRSRRIAHDLNRYGAAPLRAEIVQTKKDGDQTFAILKFVFPRGDATSLLFGFDAAGKITGVAPGGIAGD